MNYITLLNRFWGKREELNLSSIEADLYLFLIHRCNKLRWENPFCLPTKDIQITLKLTRKTINSARKKLEDVGLIKFEQGSTKGKSAKYFICDCVYYGNTIKQECVSSGNTKTPDCVYYGNTIVKEISPTPPKENNIYYIHKDNFFLKQGEGEKKITIQKLREYFTNEMVMEGQMKNNGIYDVRIYLSLCEEVLNDFIATKDENFKFDSEAKRHFINLLRIKKREKEKQRGAGAQLSRQDKREELMQSALQSVNNAINNNHYAINNEQEKTTPPTF